MMYMEIGLIALCAGLLQGMTGFGAGIVMMMVLPGLFPMGQAAGVSCAIAIVLSLSMTVRYRRYIQIKKVVWPAILYMGASGLAIRFSAMVDQERIKVVFGGFLILLAIYHLFFDKKKARALGFSVSILFIVVSGVCDGLFGIGGPLMVLFYLGQTSSKEEYLGDIQALFLLNLLYGTALRLYSHILTSAHLPFIGIGMAAILLGLFAASQIVEKLDGEKIKGLTYVAIGISGVLNMI